MSGWPYRYCLVWDFFKHSGNYEVWQEFCDELASVFSQYDNVRWGHTSFQFTLWFTEADWIAVDLLNPSEIQVHHTADEYWQNMGVAFGRLQLTAGEFMKMIRRDMA